MDLANERSDRSRITKSILNSAQDSIRGNGRELRYDATAMLFAHKISLFVSCPGTYR